MDEESAAIQPSPINRSDGVTPSERYLKGLCDRSFLSLWSYAGIYRDQRVGGKGDGKELCDLLVVFENHILIFSDKHCQFPDTGNTELDWRRWYKRAVENSAKQIWGAERWIKAYPNRLFLDRACTVPFPIDLPDPVAAKFHRVVIAHDVSERCRKAMGGSGSLIIDSTVVGDMHYASLQDGGRPFTIGQVDPEQGYVHVLDDTTLDIVLTTLDTVTDFVTYLTRKEKFICDNHRSVLAAGDDDLLGFYLQQLNENGEHDFVLPEEDLNAVFIDEGFWEDFTQSPQRKAQLEADKVSYAWDALIESFNTHILGDTQYYAFPAGPRNQEKVVRFLAREPRFKRRLLAKSLFELIAKAPNSQRATRVLLPSQPGEPYYIFLLLPHPPTLPYEKYREVRGKLLESCCMVVKLKFPDAKDIVGIATETGIDITNRSEDAVYFDARNWTEANQLEAESLQRDLGLLTNVTKFATREHEYPIPRKRRRRRSGKRTQ